MRRLVTFPRCYRSRLMARSSFRSQLWIHHLPSYCSRSRLQYFGRYLSCVVPFRANPVDSAFWSEAMTSAFVCLHSWRRYCQRFCRVSWSLCAFQRLIYVSCEFVNFLWIFSFCIPGQSLVIFFYRFETRSAAFVRVHVPESELVLYNSCSMDARERDFLIEMVYNVCVSLWVLIPSVMLMFPWICYCFFCF